MVRKCKNPGRNKKLLAISNRNFFRIQIVSDDTVSPLVCTVKVDLCHISSLYQIDLYGIIGV